MSNLFNPTLTKDDIEWFHTRYTKLSDDECWPWNAYRMKTGHGQITINYTVHYAHKIQYFLVNGSYDSSLIIRHKCDNGWCVNPNHLITGNRTDNANDRVERGRQSRISFTLFDSEIIEIFALREKGLSQTAIAKRFNVKQGFISRIIRGDRLRYQSEKLGMKFAI